MCLSLQLIGKNAALRVGLEFSGLSLLPVRVCLQSVHLRRAVEGQAGVHRLCWTRAECTGPVLGRLVLHWGEGRGPAALQRHMRSTIPGCEEGQ